MCDFVQSLPMDPFDLTLTSNIAFSELHLNQVKQSWGLIIEPPRVPGLHVTYTSLFFHVNFHAARNFHAGSTKEIFRLELLVARTRRPCFTTFSRIFLRLASRVLCPHWLYVGMTYGNSFLLKADHISNGLRCSTNNVPQCFIFCVPYTWRKMSVFGTFDIYSVVSSDEGFWTTRSINMIPFMFTWVTSRIRLQVA